jgi:DNA-binding transcriptional LysR family regulator
MPLELRPLRHLLAIVEHGSLGRAAAALNMTQPALSRSLQALEEKVGTALLLRSASGVMPTAEGLMLIEAARKMIHAADELERQLDRRRVPGAGQVSFGVGAYAHDMIVADALARFVDAFPLLRVRVAVHDWEGLPQRLRAREIEFFVSEFSTMEGEHDLDIEPLRRHQLYFVARRSHPLAGRRGFEIAHLFSYPLIGLVRYPTRGLAPILAARPEEAARKGRPLPQVQLGNCTAVKRMLARCDAIAPLPLPAVAEELASGDLAILTSPPWAVLAYGIVRLKGREPSAAAAVLMDSLREAEVAYSDEEERLTAAMLPAAEAPSSAGPRAAAPASAPARPSRLRRSGA